MTTAPTRAMSRWSVATATVQCRTRAPPAPAASRPWIMAAVAAAAVVLGIASKSGSGRPAPEKLVAVLSFVAMSEDGEIGIFADGLIEEVSHAFANIETLKVTGRTSGFFYKNRNEDLREIGATLGVAHLLEGSVRRSSDRIRATTQLSAVFLANPLKVWSPMADLVVLDFDGSETADTVTDDVAPLKFGDQRHGLHAAGSTGGAKYGDRSADHELEEGVPDLRS